MTSFSGVTTHFGVIRSMVCESEFLKGGEDLRMHDPPLNKFIFLPLNHIIILPVGIKI